MYKPFNIKTSVIQSCFKLHQYKKTLPFDVGFEIKDQFFSTIKLNPGFDLQLKNISCENLLRFLQASRFLLFHIKEYFKGHFFSHYDPAIGDELEGIFH